MKNFILTASFLVTALVAIANEKPTKRILIVGDSWATSITKENRDGFPAPDVFDDVLAANGLGQFETQGAVTAWSGRKASDWAKPQHLAEIVEELEKYPSIDIVHLILGGNDFLKAVQQEDFQRRSTEEREEIWEGVRKNLQLVVDTCLGVREEMRVVIADYDYLDHNAAETFWKMDFRGASVGTLNTWFVELGNQKRAIAENTPRCEYLENWGVFQYWFGIPPKTVTLPGGDIGACMPPGISPDGIHPNEKAHAKLLQNAIDRYYGKWLLMGEDL